MMRTKAVGGLVAGGIVVVAAAVAIPAINGLGREPDIPVYRVAEEPIGCSLAESAEAAAYGA